MAELAASRDRAAAPGPRDADLGADGVLDSLGVSVLVVAADGTIGYANAAAEQFFEAGAPRLRSQRLADLLPADSPLFGLVEQALAGPSVISEHGIALSVPRLGECRLAIQVAPLADAAGWVAISFQQQTIARQIDDQLSHRNAARSVTALAAMLAHEVKNPLSGIRGAAQLLEDGLSGADRDLTRLICDETDRICALVDDIGAFTESRPAARAGVNIHEVLEHVRRLAESGFGRGVRFGEDYDPSLPPVYGDRDQLVQVFLNLVKNACEAVPKRGGEVHLSTAYRHGMRLAVPGSGNRVLLPLQVRVQDNGEGVPEDLREHLFDPFVSTKSGGKGLGLALVAKIVNDHGGVIDVQSEPRRTVFRVMLPTVPPVESAS